MNKKHIQYTHLICENIYYINLFILTINMKYLIFYINYYFILIININNYIEYNYIEYNYTQYNILIMNPIAECDESNINQSHQQQKPIVFSAVAKILPRRGTIMLNVLKSQSILELQRLMKPSHDNQIAFYEYINSLQKTINVTQERQEKILETRYQSIFKALERAIINLNSYRESLRELKDSINRNEEKNQVLTDVENFRAYVN